MYLLRNVVVYISVTTCYLFVTVRPMKITLKDLEAENNKMLTQYREGNKIRRNVKDYMKMLRNRPAVDPDDPNDPTNKYIKASGMSQMRVLQLFYQTFKNMLAAAFTGGPNVGGATPFSVESVKPAIALFKYRIIELFFPDVGPDPRYATL